MSSEGVVFAATGVRYIEEAAASARASRPHLGGRPIAIMTDDLKAAQALGCFDRCIPHPDPRRSFRDKIPALIDPPFDRTLFLDSDARLIAASDGLFALLDHHDLAAAHAPVRIPAGWGDSSVPASFPELNSGVLLLRRGAAQQQLIKRWLELYDEVGQDWDQATLRAATWAMLAEGLRIGVLPPEANLRTTKPWIAGKGLAVTVVHGRVPDQEWPALIEFLNGDIDRFRTSSEWMTQHPATTLTPRVASSRRAGRAHPGGELARTLATVTARWPGIGDEPLPCENPIFVLAAGWRSGSTLLQRMLVAENDLMVWGEPHDRARIIQSLSAQWQPFTEEWPDERHQAPLEPGAELTESWLAKGSPAATRLRHAHRGFLDDLFGAPARDAGRPRWGLTEVRLGADHAAYLRWLYPGARFLLLVRNPFDAYASYKQRGSGVFEWPEEPVSGAAAFARIWSRLATEFHDLAGDAQCMLVRYEDLSDAVPAIREHTALASVAAPGDLSGQPTVRGSGELTLIERTTLRTRTKAARALLGY